MRQILFTIPFTLPVALVFVLATLAASLLLVFLRSKTPVAWAVAVRRALLSLATFGSLGSDPIREGEKSPDVDLSVSGSLGTVALALGLYGAVRGEPVVLPIFGYATTCFLAFVATGALAFKVAAPRLRTDPRLAVTVALLCAFWGVLGSRVFYVAEFWDTEFANQPVRIVFPPLQPDKGDELVARTSRGQARVVFDGTERATHEVVAHLAPLRAIGAVARVVTVPRRVGDVGVEQVERGLAIETEERGTRAVLALAGTALKRLPNPRFAEAGIQGTDIPLLEALAIWHGGLVYYGGMIFGTAAVWVFVYFRGQSSLQVADLASAPGGIGVAFGRLGCFLNGCCWGREVAEGSTGAIHFPLFSPAWLQHAKNALTADWDVVLSRGVMTPELAAELRRVGAAHLVESSNAVHAVQLYAIALDVLIGTLILLYVRFLVKRRGQTFFVWFILYAIVRFTIEHFRGDHEVWITVLGYPLTPSQRVALLVFPFSIAGFVWASRKGELLEPPPVPVKP